MHLSDIRGERSIDILADAMTLVEEMSEDERFKAFLEEFQNLDEKADTWKVLCRRIPPLLKEPRYKKTLISILAAANGVTTEEYAENGEVLKDLFDLLTSDVEALGFFGSSVATAE